jgi:hypothetical protein
MLPFGFRYRDPGVPRASDSITRTAAARHRETRSSVWGKHGHRDRPTAALTPAPLTKHVALRTPPAWNGRARPRAADRPDPLIPMILNSRRMVLAAIALCMSAAYGCAPAAIPANGEPPPGEAIRVRFLSPDIATEYGEVRPIRCPGPGLQAPIAARETIPPGGGSVVARTTDGRVLAELQVGPHAAPGVAYSLTARASQDNELDFEITRADGVRTPDNPPNIFTLHVHYPPACSGQFAGNRKVWLVRMEDRTAVPASARRPADHIISFRMDRLSRFVVSH